VTTGTEGRERCDQCGVCASTNILDTSAFTHPCAACAVRELRLLLSIIIGEINGDGQERCAISDDL